MVEFIDFEIDDFLPTVSEKQQINLVKYSLFKNNDNIIIFLTIHKLQPVTVSEISKQLSQKLYKVYNKGKVDYIIDKLLNLNLIYEYQYKNGTIPQTIEKEITSKINKICRLMPTQFRKAFLEKTGVKFYWVSDFGKHFINDSFNKLKKQRFNKNGN